MKTNDYISSGTFAKLGSSKANIFVTRYKIVTGSEPYMTPGQSLNIFIRMMRDI